MASRRLGSVDIQVGRRVRTARFAKGISQETLADSIGISFQQIQKYEKGMNRIGTGRLHAIAQALGVPLSYFFEGLEAEPTKSSCDAIVTAVSDALSTKEGIRIAVALARIQDQAMRRRIADLLEAIITDRSEEVRTLRNA